MGLLGVLALVAVMAEDAVRRRPDVPLVATPGAWPSEPLWSASSDRMFCRAGLRAAAQQ